METHQEHLGRVGAGAGARVRARVWARAGARARARAWATARAL